MLVIVCLLFPLVVIFRKVRKAWLANTTKVLRCVHSMTSGADPKSEPRVVPTVVESNITMASVAIPDKAPSTVDGVQPCSEPREESAHLLWTNQQQLCGNASSGVVDIASLPHQEPVSIQRLPQLTAQQSPVLQADLLRPIQPCTPSGIRSGSPVLSSLSNSKNEPLKSSQDLYARVTSLLDALQLSDLLPVFKSSFIKVCVCVSACVCVRM